MVKRVDMWNRRSFAAAALALTVLAGCGDDDASAPDVAESVIEVDEIEPGGDPGGPDSLHFTFTGAEGEAGCHYEGPAEISTEMSSTVTNESNGVVTVTLGRLAEGATVDDFETYLRTLGDSYPVLVPPADHQPSAHDWLEGEWLQLHTVAGGESHHVEKSSMFEGDYVAFCFRPSVDEPGSQLWPAGTVRVTA